MARVPRRARAAIDRLTRCGTEAALRPPPVCCASASGHDHVTARFQGANVPLGLPQRPRQSEMREDAAIGKPRCGRDPLTLEREDEQRVRARDGGLRRRQLHANAGWPFRPRRGLPSTSIRRRDPFEGCIPCWGGCWGRSGRRQRNSSTMRFSVRMGAWIAPRRSPVRVRLAP
jgi:hypothetical protein